MISGTPTPAAPQISASPGTGGGSGLDAYQPSDRTGGIIGWPWTGLLFLLLLVAVTWRFRSWLMGVLENVVILGKSGADLETELLHHETSPRVEDAQTGGADDLVEAAPAAEAVDTDTEPPQEC